MFRGIRTWYYVSNDQIVNGKRIIPGEKLPHGPLEPSGATEGDDAVRCVTAQQWRRHATPRQHALTRTSDLSEAMKRRIDGMRAVTCLSQQATALGRWVC